MPSPPQTPQYLQRILAMVAAGALPTTPGYHQVIVRHDDACGIWRQQPCDCAPEVSLAFSLPAGSEN